MRCTTIATAALVAFLGGALVAGDARAQASPYPTVNTGTGQLIQQGVTGSRNSGGASTRFEQRLNDQSRYSVQQQSCGGLSGVSADRCNSELRTTIEADKLRNQAIDAGQPRNR